MATTARMRKVNETVKEALAEVLNEAISDPRLRLVTITGVEVARDLRTARVYVIAHGGEDRYREVLEGLDAARNRIRKELAGRVSMKFLPHFDYVIDPSVDEGMRIAEALKVVPPHVPDEGDAETGAAGPEGT